MRLSLFLVLCLLCGYSQAAIYKWKLPDGTVVFSDQPNPGAEEVELPKLQTYTPPPSPAFTSEVATPTQNAPAYTTLMITTPGNDEAIRENSGKIEINIAVEPPLQIGDKILVKMDGQAIGDPSSSQHYILDNVDRGTHTLQATVLDADGNSLIDSEAVTFHLQRVSILFKNRPLPVNPTAPTNPPSGS
jgi:Domain of unknown function (DUF4124)